MVLADVESQLFREGSRGLPGGSFLLATVLNRKDAKTVRFSFPTVKLLLNKPVFAEKGERCCRSFPRILPA